jgi:hypothetical protein
MDTHTNAKDAMSRTRVRIGAVYPWVSRNWTQ